jgi:hypothetical protein
VAAPEPAMAWMASGALRLAPLSSVPMRLACD